MLLNRPNVVAVVVMALCGWSAATDAFAQSRGRVSVGIGVTSIQPRDSDLQSTTFVNPIVRLNPGEGWGFNGALNWFESDVSGNFAGLSGRLGTVQVRPLMGGVSYGWRRGSLWTSVSVVGGPSFNRLRLKDAASAQVTLIERETWTVAVRPGFSVTYGVAPRVGVTGFAGYLFNRPKFTVRTSSADITNNWTTDAVVLSAGVVYSLF
jgi:hypothetical protein